MCVSENLGHPYLCISEKNKTTAVLILKVTKMEPNLFARCRLPSLHRDWRPRLRRASFADPARRADGWRRVRVPGCPGCHEVPSCPSHRAGWVQIKHTHTHTRAPNNTSAVAKHPPPPVGEVQNNPWKGFSGVTGFSHSFVFHASLRATL